MSARRSLVLLLGALVVTAAAVLPAVDAWADDTDAAVPVTIVLFRGEGCPHCAAEEEFLNGLRASRPGLVVEDHEVWFDDAGRALLLQTADRLGFEATGVPVTVIGDRYWIGFDDTTAAAITAAVEGGATGGPPPAAPRTVDVPLVGSVPLEDTSLLTSTLAIGFVDGINPCSLWVLSLLLAMVLNRGTRARVLLVGGVFLAVTAGMYGLYMLGMYSAASYLSGMAWLRVVVALIAGTFGVLQVKDGLGVRSGPSLSIAAGRRPGLYSRMRGVASPDRALAVTIVGTAGLAVAVSLLETPCTAGLPLLWTTLLAEQGVGPVQAGLLFAAYLAVFLLDELVVFAVAVVTLRATRLQERQGRLLKLVAGSVLIALAVTMLVAPAAMASLGGTALVFGIAVAAALLVYAVSGSAADRVSSSSS